MTTSTTTRPRQKQRLEHPDPLIDSVDIAGEVGVTKPHAWTMMNAGVFGPVVDVSAPGSQRASLRIRRSQLDAWISQRTFVPTSAA